MALDTDSKMKFLEDIKDIFTDIQDDLVTLADARDTINHAHDKLDSWNVFFINDTYPRLIPRLNMVFENMVKIVCKERGYDYDDMCRGCRDKNPEALDVRNVLETTIRDGMKGCFDGTSDDVLTFSTRGGRMRERERQTLGSSPRT